MPSATRCRPAATPGSCWPGSWACPENDRRALIARALDWAAGPGRDHSGAAWLAPLADRHPGDAGVLAPLLLNAIELRPGEAMYLPPGELHAYLHGTGLELMANSDNVLRGGLTSKHVDPRELLATLADRSGPVEILRPEPISEALAVYRTPAPEFELGVIALSGAGAVEVAADHGVEILLCLDGDCEIAGQGQPPLALDRGDSAFVPHAAPAYALRGSGRVYRARPGSSASSSA